MLTAVFDVGAAGRAMLRCPSSYAPILPRDVNGSLRHTKTRGDVGLTPGHCQMLWISLSGAILMQPQ